MPFEKLIREYLGYDPKNGAVTWIKNPNPSTTARIKAGDIAGRLHPLGYHTITFKRKTLRRGRLAWFLSHGVWPPHQIDHINGIKNDDRLINLRVATPSENSRNRKTRGNETGVKGVQFTKNRYIASVMVKGVYHYVGCFIDLNTAEAAVKSARERLHKEFTNHG